MSPFALLEDVKARFAILLIQEPEALQRLLRIALQIYQDKAGHVCEWRLTPADLPPFPPYRLPAPSNALLPIAGSDARGAWFAVHEAGIYLEPEPDEDPDTPDPDPEPDPDSDPDSDPDDALDPEPEPEPVKPRMAWEIDLTACHIAPLTIRYFFDFVGMDLTNDDLPRGSVGMIGDYLYSLIDIANTARHRQVNQSAEIPHDHLRSDAELYQAKRELEEAMQEQCAIIPPIIAA